MSTPLSRAFAIIPAAGMGKRMGASINKQYLLLDNKPILAHTLAVFQKCDLITGIILVTPQDEIPYCRSEVVERYALDKVLTIVPGGTERQFSVMNGLQALRDHSMPHDVVLIHDGVRPLISPELLHQAITTVANGEGSLVAVPTKDTIKVIQDGLVTATPDRTTLWQAQTPQSFRYDQIMGAHQKAKQEGYLGTDDCSLVERYGGRIRVVPGNYHNIKITTPEDLVLAEAFLKGAAEGVSP